MPVAPWLCPLNDFLEAGVKDTENLNEMSVGFSSFICMCSVGC